MRKSRNTYNREKAEALRLQGYSIKEISIQIDCAEITCFTNLKNIKPLKYFKEVSNKHVVYEFYDINDKCIYVGQSKNFHRRLLQHKLKSTFYMRIKKIICYIFESFPDMTFAEAQLIIQKEPEYNKRITGSNASQFQINYIEKIEYNMNGVKLN